MRLKRTLHKSNHPLRQAQAVLVLAGVRAVVLLPQREQKQKPLPTLAMLLQECPMQLQRLLLPESVHSLVDGGKAVRLELASEREAMAHPMPKPPPPASKSPHGTPTSPI